jgi:hypothetical protein
VRGEVEPNVPGGSGLPSRACPRVTQMRIGAASLLWRKWWHWLPARRLRPDLKNTQSRFSAPFGGQEHRACFETGLGQRCRLTIDRLCSGRLVAERSIVLLGRNATAELGRQIDVVRIHDVVP